MQQVVDDSTTRTPLIFVLSPGVVGIDLPFKRLSLFSGLSCCLNANTYMRTLKNVQIGACAKSDIFTNL